MARTKPTGSPPSKEPHRKAAMDTDKQRPATESAVSRTSLSASVQSQAYAPSGWQCQPPRQQQQPPAQQGPPPGGQHHDYARGSYYYSRSRADERRDTREPCRSNEPRYRHERAGGNEGYNRRDREYNNSSFAGGGMMAVAGKSQTEKLDPTSGGEVIEEGEETVNHAKTETGLITEVYVAIIVMENPMLSINRMRVAKVIVAILRHMHKENNRVQYNAKSKRQQHTINHH
ncbi:predicted protein [Thalassiosira pseudonana CCMP1335]|uniref:Uncharacterized protein n=1 Tax=Thalassiosira pseudonana TaxID=35128 RepID=B8C5X6_THAPS|nr:predicted protein [Thalassiosira pseudonana CCMP1335]EED91583.1 predicted protein [Thalassiosira pseudonana CCMP1335]